jgi:hypothetical protein
MVIGLQKPYTKTEIGAGLELSDVYLEVLQCICFTGIKIPRINDQDQKKQ